jgi:hypothetical protein
LAAALASTSWPQRTEAAGCDAAVGRWDWFIGGVVAINADGTVVQEVGGNHGTWECTDPARASFTVRWLSSGFVNRLVLSADGGGLSSTDPTQAYVTAKRRVAAPAALALTTVPYGQYNVPSNLPKLTHAATQHARRTWRSDAIPVALEAGDRDAPNPAARGPEVRLFFLSPSEGTGISITVTERGARTLEFNQPVRWGTESLPPLFIDLPMAIDIAREDGGAQGHVGGGSLRVWNPSGTMPVVAWMVGDKTVDAVTGEIIDFDVTGYIERYNADWKRLSDAFNAVLQSMQSSNVDPWEDDDWSPYDYCAYQDDVPPLCQGPF